MPPVVPPAAMTAPSTAWMASVGTLLMMLTAVMIPATAAAIAAATAADSTSNRASVKQSTWLTLPKLLEEQ